MQLDTYLAQFEAVNGENDGIQQILNNHQLSFCQIEIAMCNKARGHVGMNWIHTKLMSYKTIVAGRDDNANENLQRMHICNSCTHAYMLNTEYGKISRNHNSWQFFHNECSNKKYFEFLFLSVFSQTLFSEFHLLFRRKYKNANNRREYVMESTVK